MVSRKLPFILFIIIILSLLFIALFSLIRIENMKTETHTDWGEVLYSDLPDFRPVKTSLVLINSSHTAKVSETVLEFYLCNDSEGIISVGIHVANLSYVAYLRHGERTIPLYPEEELDYKARLSFPTSISNTIEETEIIEKNGIQVQLTCPGSKQCIFRILKSSENSSSSVIEIPFLIHVEVINIRIGWPVYSWHVDGTLYVYVNACVDRSR
ncbi:MAG: hypothetical protein QXP68_06070 [Thermosphaera sp.]